jgi:hypothetical protein
MLRRVAFRRILLRPPCHRVSLKARSADNTVVSTPLSRSCHRHADQRIALDINSRMSVSVAKPVRQREYFRSLRYSICAELPPFNALPQQCYTTHGLYNLLAAILSLHVSADNPLFPTLATYPLKTRNCGPQSKVLQEWLREAVTKFWKCDWRS